MDSDDASAEVPTDTPSTGLPAVCFEGLVSSWNIPQISTPGSGGPEKVDPGVSKARPTREDCLVPPCAASKFIGIKCLGDKVMWTASDVWRDIRSILNIVCGSWKTSKLLCLRDFLYDFKVVDGGSVRYVPGLRRSLISLDTLEKEGYTMKMQMGRIKVIKGCRVMMTGIKKKKCVYTLKAKVMTFGVQKHGGSKQVGFKQLASKQVGFKQLGHKQVEFKQIGPGVETGVHGVQVSNDDVTVAQRRLKDKQLEENTNIDCLVKEQEKEHLGIKVRANITVTGVPGQEGAEGNVAEKKKVKESMKANLGKLLKYTIGENLG
ncbi:hypothetical protein Tco_1166613 [Tanacetum coccineum]